MDENSTGTETGHSCERHGDEEDSRRRRQATTWPTEGGASGGAREELGKIKLDEFIAQGSLDFEDWTKLISYVEHVYHDEINKITLVYDSFLSEFPLCYGYWKKYAEHNTRLCSVEKAVQIFERAVESAPYSVGVWVDYCSFSVSSFEDPSEICRLFERGLSFVGKDYQCHILWDKYIEYEYSQQHWNSLANIYVQTLKFPSRKLNEYYESFKKLVAIWEEMECYGNFSKEVQSQHEMDCDIKASKDSEISSVINELLDPFNRPKALQKFISIGQQFYRRSCDLDVKVRTFEQKIHRPYFHVKQLDDEQLQNWHQYLDLVEMEGDFDWTVKLYERCLISCANYAEFWMRYVDYVESKGGKELATDALERATNTFLKNSTEIQLFNAWYKEKEGDFEGAHAAFLQCNQDSDYHFIDIVRRKANTEKRLGNYVAASDIYKEGIKLAAEKRPQTLTMLYVHFTHFLYTIPKDVEATRGILLDGIRHAPYSKLLIKELIFFALMHEGAIQVDVLDSIVEKALTPDVSCGLSTEEREELSRLYLEFIDLRGIIHDVRKAWNRHLRLFPQSVRVQSSFKKPVKSVSLWEMLTIERAGSVDSHPQKPVGEDSENHLIHQPSQEEKLLTGEKSDKSEQTKCGAIESTDKAADDKDLLEVDKDSRSKDIQQEHSLQQKKRPSPDDKSQNISASCSPILEAPQEASLSNASTPVSVHDIDHIPSISCPVSPGREDNAAERFKEPLGPSSNLSNKTAIPAISTDHHPSDRDRNQHRLNPPGKGRLDSGSPRKPEERLERSLSPRRRGSREYLNERHYRERSLSPRRQSCRRYSDDRWHRDRQDRRYYKHQDNLRGRRDGRMQSQNQVNISNALQIPNARQQFPTLAPLPIQQAISFPQTSQYPPSSTEQCGNAQNNPLYSQMWQYYYYNQQQLLLQQPPTGQLQQMQPPQQLNPSQQQQVQNPQQVQQISPHQQQQLLQYQQEQLYPHHLQPTDQPQSQQQQSQSQQQLYQQMQIQPQEQQQLQQQQVQLQQQHQPQQQQQHESLNLQQQQAYQYQEFQKQQYILYLQQLQLYQNSQQQSGLSQDQQSLQQQHKLPGKQDEQENLPELQHGDEKLQHQQGDGLSQVTGHHLQVHGVESTPSSTFGPEALAPSQDELPEIEGTDG